jgi:hypothetical protein
MSVAWHEVPGVFRQGEARPVGNGLIRSLPLSAATQASSTKQGPGVNSRAITPLPTGRRRAIQRRGIGCNLDF